MSPVWPPFIQGVDMRIAHDWATESDLFIRFCLLAPALTVRSRVAGRSRHLTASWYDSISIILSRFSPSQILLYGTGFVIGFPGSSADQVLSLHFYFLDGVGSGVVQMGVAYDDF
ncbi:hypothetical protein ASPTUDRAFT_57105 [Aspergillus tubingensis CBS 134.48]|uniref:Uncharacterized protein n=1 Tax=Aspergillus tubingensis (strain CBS 134.48) TaxID=767770 RepID=A0A1L9N1G2_ASPTC|nr:hypothetical protein ASPTUDRAFT_57105 [Aspergillus tubingensis CBS 134.48]